ncbi:solute carrier family 4 member 4a [Pleuronectes platessa]|uniref:solute carrier family 4 member 4a n=1 Tax=Pleuronectes platessa TaxID=8262 RepID=UPI00232A0B91|nr:solute carrier family 4 member 4a [Pleuronectes platessa]
MSNKKMEDEAVLDRGASFVKHLCDEEEVEGHHTVYIGVHVPKSYRRRRRHRRRAGGHRDRKERQTEGTSDKSDTENNDEASNSILKPLISPAAERIRFMLGEEDDGPAPPQLFTELDELLSVDGQEMEWKETARNYEKCQNDEEEFEDDSLTRRNNSEESTQDERNTTIPRGLKKSGAELRLVTFWFPVRSSP